MTTTKYKTNKEIIPPIETYVESSWFLIKLKIYFYKTFLLLHKLLDLSLQHDLSFIIKTQNVKLNRNKQQ